LRAAESLAGQGKKVLVIVDACFAGQLRVNARDQLNKNYPQGGGVILMVSSMPSQSSAALGQFSAFAQAVFEGLSGYADFDGNGQLRLADTTWSGRENLQGFGNLSFRFAANGQVTMLDAAGSTPGTYTVSGDQVTLRFNNGQTIYSGRVQGNTMSGTARGGR